MILDFQYIKYFILGSIAVYFIFEHFDKKNVRDEREELIRLKTFELVQKTTSFAILVLAAANWLYTEMSASVAIIVMILFGMYSEIFGKLYFRQKL